MERLERQGRLKLEITGYLKANHVMTLATSNGERPWATPVFYASSGFDLFFLSDPESRHAANVRQNPLASAAIHGDCAGWKEIKGMQLEGKVERLSPAEVPWAMGVYLARFPFVKEFATPDGSFRIGGRAVWASFYRLRPSRLVLTDNSKGFGHREELLVE